MFLIVLNARIKIIFAKGFMITIIVGQRGVGKSHFLKRLETYFREENIILETDQVGEHFIDLDSWIENNEQMSISKIFAQYGENYFRSLELSAFQNLIQKFRNTKVPVYIAVGGGFDLDHIDDTFPILWLQRKSDSWGRIFLDRPRLDNTIGPIEEFQQRANRRKIKFAQRAWDEYVLPEGLHQNDIFEKQLILNKVKNLGGILTLLPSIFSSNLKWKHFIEKRLSWDFLFFEIRDDLLTSEQIEMAMCSIPKDKILLSLRKGQLDISKYRSRVAKIDCDLTLIHHYDSKTIDIISTHDRKSLQNLNELELWEKQGFHLKLAVEVASFDELLFLHEWQNKSPLTRSFLPRSEFGIWKWYRLIMKNKMLLQFIREGDGSALDQPTMSEWLRQPQLSSQFAALLGSPVDHSYTPVEQFEYFNNLKSPMSVVAVDIKEDEFISAMPVLQKLGLYAAAVTSPLKLLAFEFCSKTTPEAQEFKSVNTLVYVQNSHWWGHNTDLVGLDFLLKKVSLDSVVVWGGGGTLPLLQKLLPNAIFYSAQIGKPRENQELESTHLNPQIIIWAAPGYAGLDKNLFPSHWQPQYIVDLNYREDSVGRLTAIHFGAQYLSGESMFYKQAEGQRQFWNLFK